MGRNNSIEQEKKQHKNKNGAATKAGQGNPKLDRPDRPAT